MKLGKPKRYTWFRNASDKVDNSSVIVKMASPGSHHFYQKSNLVTNMSSWLLVPRGRNFRHILATVVCVILVYQITLLAISTKASISLTTGAVEENISNDINSLPVVAALIQCESCEEDALGDVVASNQVSQPQSGVSNINYETTEQKVPIVGTSEVRSSQASMSALPKAASQRQIQSSADDDSDDDKNNKATNLAPPLLPAETSGSNYNYYYTDEVGIANKDNRNSKDQGAADSESVSSGNLNDDDNQDIESRKTVNRNDKRAVSKKNSAPTISQSRKGLKEGLARKKLLNHQYQKRRKLLDSIFLSIKSTKRFHKSRLGPVVTTWFNLARDQTWIFTDDDDPELNRKTNGHVVNTHCPSTHYRQALCCKMSAEFDTFIKSQKSWFCHFDDDNYVNVPALLQALSKYDHKEDWYLGKPSLKIPIKIPHPDNKSEEISFWFATGGAGFCLSRALAKRMSPVASGGKFTKLCDSIQLPDDVTIGYIAGHLLGRNLTVIPQFHSHYETMRFLDMKNPYPEITFSYVRYWDNSLNILEIDGFSEEEDPTRFLSLHCLLFPNFSFCPKSKR